MPTLDSSSPAAVYGDTSSNSSLVTASFTPPSGSIVVAKVHSADASQTHTTPTGLTFTSRASIGVASNARVTIYTATGGGSAVTVTAAFGGSTSLRALVVEVWTSAALAGTPATNTANGTGAPSSTITTTGTGSVVTWANGDWQPVDGASRTYRSSATETAYHYVFPELTHYSAYQAAASAGSQTYGLSAPTGQKWSLAALEIQASGGGSTFTASGTSAATSTTTGAATGLMPGAGTSAAVSTTTGAVTAKMVSAGTNAATSAVTGSVTSILAAAGTVAATSTTTGDATRVPIVYAASGTSAATSTTTGAVTSVLTAGGTSAAVSTTSGSASVVGGPVTYPVTGTAAAVSTTTGAVTSRMVAAGSSAAQSSVSGALTSILTAAGTVTVVSTVSGDVTLPAGPQVYPVDGIVYATSGAYGSPTGGSDSLTYLLTPPTKAAYGPEWESLWGRVAHQQGRALCLHDDGRVTVVDVTDPDDHTVIKFWSGGRIYEITATEAAILTAAGYAANLTLAS